MLTIAVVPVGSWARRHRWPGWLPTLFALVMAYAILLVLLVGAIICLAKVGAPGVGPFKGAQVQFLSARPMRT